MFFRKRISTKLHPEIVEDKEPTLILVRKSILQTVLCHKQFVDQNTINNYTTAFAVANANHGPI